MSDIYDPIDEFASALHENGFRLEARPVMDSAWHRAPVEGDKPGTTSGSYRGFLDDGVPRGIINNFKHAEPVTWIGKGGNLSAPALSARRAEIAASKKADDHSLLEQHKAVARVAYGIFANARPAPMNHPYLLAKQIDSFGLKIDKNNRLLVPLRDEDGFLWSFQWIDPDGRKGYLKGSRKAGLFHIIDPNQSIKNGGHIMIGEGYSTAAALHEASRRATVVGFDSGNLSAVASAIHKLHPGRTLIIGADDDHNAKVFNGGIKGAEKAVTAVVSEGGSAFYVVPPFTDAEKAAGLTDWNDLRRMRGIDESIKALIRSECEVSKQIGSVKTRPVRSMVRERDFGL
tara:strand:- start:2711 stop:3742 length:1032 start_codon:yes stop_codon:yes gene_type:complete